MKNTRGCKEKREKKTCFQTQKADSESKRTSLFSFEICRNIYIFSPAVERGKFGVALSANVAEMTSRCTAGRVGKC